MAEQLVNSVKMSYKRYKSLSYSAFSLIIVIFVIIGILLTYGQVVMPAQPTNAQQKELVDAVGRSGNLGFTSAFYFLSPLAAIELSLIVIGVAISVFNFSYVEPDMNRYIIDEVSTLGFGIQRKFFRKYEIHTKEGKISLKFIPYNGNSAEWCLFKLKCSINGENTKNELEEIALRHMLALKENKIIVVCNFEEFFFKLILMTKALGEIRQHRTYNSSLSNSKASLQYSQ
ncbi:MAG: hypothetical protein ACFFCD_08325 [Promethearchaeota archaeon]